MFIVLKILCKFLTYNLGAQSVFQISLCVDGLSTRAREKYIGIEQTRMYVLRVSLVRYRPSSFPPRKKISLFGMGRTTTIIK